MESLCSKCMQNNSQTKNLPYQSKNIGSNYFFGGKNEIESKSTENLIFQAIKNLKAKIKLLDFQKGEAAILLPGCHNNDNNSSEAYIATVTKHDSTENIIGDLEKNLASEALKMAEKRCVLLENQLSAMKRLFLRKIAKESCDDSINMLFKNRGERRVGNTGNMSIDLEEGLVEVASSVVDDSESVESLGLAEDLLVERNVSSGADCEMFNIIKENSKEIRTRKTDRLEEGCHRTYKDKIEKNVSNISSKPVYTARQKLNIPAHPFILGGSTANSYNSNVTKQRPLRNITQKDVYKARSKVDSTVGKNLAEASINNLRSIYSDLCGEYEFLLNKKVRILDTLHQMKGKNLLQQKQFLNDISQTLPLKRLQIHKIKTMINNFNTYKTDYPNVHWEI